MKAEISFKKTKPTEKDKDGVFEATELSKVASALPIAPTPERNNEKALFSSDSPLTWGDHDHDTLDDGILAPAAADLDSSPRTPKAAVFDPFAPGPGDLILAPQVKKFTVKSKVDVVRRLNFDAIESEDIQEELFLGKIYESLLEAIVAKQIEGVVGDGLFAKKIESCGTPDTGVPLLNGIAETCPAAPRKSRSVAKKNVLGLCRKLEF